MCKLISRFAVTVTIAYSNYGFWCLNCQTEPVGPGVGPAQGTLMVDPDGGLVVPDIADFRARAHDMVEMAAVEVVGGGG